MKIASSLPWGLSRASLPDLNVPGWMENEEIVCLGPAVHTVLGGAVPANNAWLRILLKMVSTILRT